MKLVFTAALSLALVYVSCKSSQKLLDEGKYERAFYSAIDDLRKNAGNASARDVLPEAYEQARKQLLANIHSATAGPETGDKLDRIYNAYRSLQKMYSALGSARAADAIITGVDYSEELAGAAEAAAYFHYEQGLGFLNQGDRRGAQKAYEQFKATGTYVPGYKDVDQLKDEALDRAVIHVVINTIRQQFGPYSINGSFLETDILNSLSSIGRNYYYLFYLLPEAQYRQVRVDQYMDLLMYDVSFGRLATNSYSYEVTKTIKEQPSNTKEAPQSITVKATVRVMRRIMDSRAAMDCRVSDADSRRILFSERFTSGYTWENLTGSYTGDARALGDKDRAIINGVYNNPPDYNDLYRELTRKIMNDFNSRMRQIYGR